MSGTDIQSKAAGRVPHLAENLRHLCRQQRSTSAVCRSLGINRQQFNKYLSGAAMPSPFNLSKISAHFGLDCDDLRQPPATFRRKVTLGSPPAAAEAVAAAVAALAGANATALRPYVGDYFRYNYAFDSSGRVVRGLFRVVEADGLFLTRLVERVQHRTNGSTKLTTLKYDGVLAALSGCLFNVEYERLMRSCVGHAAFPCLMRPGQRFLTGVQSSFSSSTGRPAASRVVLERVPAELSLRDALRRCGTFGRKDGMIDADVLALIGNRASRETEVFSPALV